VLLYISYCVYYKNVNLECYCEFSGIVLSFMMPRKMQQHVGAYKHA